MNWHTKETCMVVLGFKYFRVLKTYIENELHFLTVLYVVIQHWNEHIEGNGIDSSKVDGNEVYLCFCEACGIEKEGWK